MPEHRLPAARLVVAGSVLAAVMWPAAPALAQSSGEPPTQTSSSQTQPSAPWYQEISINGLVSASFVANFNSPASRQNQFRIFDADDRSMKLDVAELVLQRAITTPGQAGFRVDITFGSSVSRVTAAAGLFRNKAGEAGDFDVHQAYASYIVPVGRGLRVDAGKFVTHVGYEVVEGYDGFNDNHSRSLLFGYAEPITHTGVRLSYAINDTVSAQVHLVNGWDNAVDNNTGKSVGAQLAVTPSQRVTLTVNYLGGPEQAEKNDHMRHLVDLIAVSKLTPALTVAANYDYGREAAAALAESAGGGVKDSTWQGLAGYARYAFSDRLGLTLRGEWFDDPQGARTGHAQTLAEITLTPEYRPHQKFIVRGDLRRDQSDRAVFEQRDGTFGKSQFTASLNILFVF